MNTRRQFIQCSLAAAAGTSRSASAHAQTTGEWKSLFDGKTLKGWKKVPRIYVHNAIGEAKTPEAVEAAIEKTLEWHRSQDSETLSPSGRLEGCRWGDRRWPGSTRQPPRCLPDDRRRHSAISNSNTKCVPTGGPTPVCWCGNTRRAPSGSRYSATIRPGGGIGGFFTNGLGSYLAAPVVVDGDIGDNFQGEKSARGQDSNQTFLASKFPMQPPMSSFAKSGT